MNARQAIRETISHVDDALEKLNFTPGADKPINVAQRGMVVDIMGSLERKSDKPGYSEVDMRADRAYLKEHLRRYKALLGASRRRR